MRHRLWYQKLVVVVLVVLDVVVLVVLDVVVLVIDVDVAVPIFCRTSPFNIAHGKDRHSICSCVR